MKSSASRGPQETSATGRKPKLRKKDLEQQLIKAQKFEALGTLAGGIAHDFNNILSAVIGFSELALEDSVEGTNFHSNIQQIQIVGNRARELVLQILAFARQTEAEVRPVRVDRIAKEALKLINTSLPRIIRIEANIYSETRVLADPVQIHQVLMNLCTNAAHAMREKGSILGVDIKPVKITKTDNMTAANMATGDYVMVAVSDTGTGMSESLIKNIFEPCFTTKPVGEGTGIGLSVIKNIIDKLNGTIEAKSTPGQGTVFTIFIPATQEKPRSFSISDQLLVGGTERIMFVDDKPSIAALGEQVLRRMGYQVAAFENNERINKTPDIPVILCTGYSDRVFLEKAAQLGIKAFLRKPLSREDLLRTVRSV